ncbi:hypothetical protein ATOP_17640 [Granulimonas faecalis]|uniref:Polysaccharide biosynthesis protein n=1 Tax=Granulimonas faecalis TaxID=2894155 RepID=A0AAV5B6V4_9ACTN|nr:lipopolysaccharide biosynthesis protein [Granulimonas faecalis]GJM56109.1 hypothetical protein ATOP_17640 [Granulimonas faecalis]
MASQRKLGALLGYMNILIKNLVNLAYTPMLLAFVGSADYGVYQSANSFVFALSLLSFGFSGAYVKFYTSFEKNGTSDDIRRLNGMYLLVYAVVSLGAFVLGSGFALGAPAIFSDGFTQEQSELARSLMTVMSATIAVTLFSTVFDSYLLVHEEFKFQQSRQIATTLVTPIAAYVLLVAGFGAMGVAVAQLVVTVALLLLNVRFTLGKLHMRFDLGHFDKALFRAIVVFSAWVFMNQVSDLVNQNVPNILLGARSGAVAVAVFAVSVQVRNVFVYMSSTMSSVFVPKINRIVAESDDNRVLTGLMTTVGRYQMMLFCWLYGGFVLLGRFFVSRWAGPEFMDAYWLICIMALPLGIPLCQNTGIEIQKAKNRHRARSVVLMVMALLNVAFTWVAAPALGYWAPAIAYVVTIAVGNGAFMNWYYHFRIGLDMRIFWARVLRIVVVALAVVCIFSLMIAWMPVASWLGFVFWGLLYTVCFGAACWFLALDDGERGAIERQVPFI